LPSPSSKIVNPRESTKYSLTATRLFFLKSIATQEIHVWNPTVNIINPKPNISVKAQETISGTFSGDLPEDYHIWIVVRGDKSAGDMWWTQGDSSIESMSYWSVLGSFGGEQDVGDNFYIRAILVDKNVDYILKENGKNGIRLPTSIKSLATTKVIRDFGDVVLGITSPKSGDYVSTPVPLEGTIYGSITKDHDIWIIHSPINSERWYPDGSIVNNIVSDSWKQEVNLSDPAGTEYIIKAVLVDNETSKEYKESIKIGTESSSWPGFNASEEESRAKVLGSIYLKKAYS
jgi:hypothetical protein